MPSTSIITVMLLYCELYSSAISVILPVRIATYGKYSSFPKANISSTIAIFFAAFLGDLLTYVATSFQLAFAFPAPTFGTALTNFLVIFAVTQVPLAIGEGILTVIIWDRLKAYKPKLLDKLGALAPNEA